MLWNVHMVVDFIVGFQQNKYWIGIWLFLMSLRIYNFLCDLHSIFEYNPDGARITGHVKKTLSYLVKLKSRARKNPRYSSHLLWLLWIPTSLKLCVSRNIKSFQSLFRKHHFQPIHINRKIV